MLKKTIISCAMIRVFALALASSGGGDKKKETLRKPDFTPIRTTNGFTLKAGPAYTGSHTFNSVSSNNYTRSTVVTYQQGNKVFILPYKSTSRVVNFTPDRSSYNRNNLNAFDLKIRLRK